MTTDIFIRTCAKDLPWLKFAVRSIQERVTGYRGIIITAPKPVAARISRATGMPVIGVDPFRDDYIGQQHTKMTATLHTDADVICFWDSDTVAAETINLSELLFRCDDGRLILHHVPFDGLSNGSEIWRPIVARDMGFIPDHEFMRRLPLAYHRSTLIGCVEHIERTHNMPLRAYMNRLPQRSFTEFNCIGAWAYLNERDRYDFRIDEAEVAEWKRRVRQFWSWGGITSEVMDEMKEIGLR